MARIGEITVQWLGGSKVLRKQLDPQVNIFFGKNGGGKTTLLRTLCSALQNNATLIADSTVQSASIEIESHQYKQKFTRTLAMYVEATAQLNFNLVDIPTNSKTSEKKISWKWETDANFEQREAAFGVLYLPVSRLYTEALRQASRSFSLSSWGASVGSEESVIQEPTLEATFVAQFNRKWSTYANRLLADIKSIQQHGIGNILQTLLSNTDSQQVPEGDPDKAYNLAKKFFERQPELSSIVRNATQFKNHYSMNPALRAVMRNIEVVEQSIEQAQTQREYLSNILNSLFENKRIHLSDSGITIESVDGVMLTPAQLSTGEKQLMSLCVDMLSIDGSGILIIDEPEMSLHVEWQKVLLETLHNLNPVVQIIVATHSPEIMANFEGKNIFHV